MCVRKSALIALIAVMLTGCSFAGANTASQTQNATFYSMEDEAVISYEVPTSYPHIIVDQLGYAPGSKKLAFMFGSVIPGEFLLVDATTGKTVFTAKVTDKGYYEEYGSNVGMADFTEYGVPGEYYIEADHLGRSYSFGIQDDLYGGIFNESCRKYYYNRCGITLTEDLAGENAHNACHTQKALLRQDMTVQKDVSGGWHQDSTGSKDIITASGTLGTMLMAYEIFPAAFADDTGIPESGNGIPDILDEARFEVEWFLKMQDETTGSVYSGITVTPNEHNSSFIIYVEPADIESSRAFAFAVAKFGYLFQNYDRDFATVCLQAADRAFKYSVLNEEEDGSFTPYKLSSACEIYRASGSAQCQGYINVYFQSEPDLAKMDDVTLMGLCTYLSTKMSVNQDYCRTAITAIMKEAEDISADLRSYAVRMPESEDIGDNSKIFHDMMVMTIVDHIITNNEYDNIIENFMHYFLGRNKMSVSFIDDAGEYSYKQIHESLGIMKQFDSNSKLIFMLSKMISRDGFVKEQ